MAKGWHVEECEYSYAGQKFLLEEKKVLYDKQSQYQHIKVFVHEKYGTVLSLDDCIQATTYDEFLYQEMLSFLPLCSHPAPKSVLIIGGGDGGVAREVLKDERVSNVVLVDIDEEVLSVCKKYMPSMAASLDDSRVKIVIEDATKYVQDTEDRFDVIILDLTDNGVADEKILGEEFYINIRRIILDNGIIAQQTYCPYSNDDRLAAEVKVFKKTADKICYGFVPVPSFPNGNIGILFGRVYKSVADSHRNLSVPIYSIDENKALDMGLKCYYNKYHQSCCVLPLDFSRWFYNL